jgi:hypothetical protein
MGPGPVWRRIPDRVAAYRCRGISMLASRPPGTSIGSSRRSISCDPL